MKGCLTFVGLLIQMQFTTVIPKLALILSLLAVSTPHAYAQAVLDGFFVRLTEESGFAIYCNSQSVQYLGDFTYSLQQLSIPNGQEMERYRITSQGTGINGLGVYYHVSSIDDLDSKRVEENLYQVQWSQVRIATTNDAASPDYQLHTSVLYLYDSLSGNVEVLNRGVNFTSCSYPGLPSSGNGGCGNGGHCPK
jgi:hypothetical protein